MLGYALLPAFVASLLSAEQQAGCAAGVRRCGGRRSSRSPCTSRGSAGSCSSPWSSGSTGRRRSAGRSGSSRSPRSSARTLSFLRSATRPEKFVALVALTYAVCFGLGVERLAERDRAGRREGSHRPALAAATLVACLPLVYTPTPSAAWTGRSRSATTRHPGPEPTVCSPWRGHRRYAAPPARRRPARRRPHTKEKVGAPQGTGPRASRPYPREVSEPRLSDAQVE